MIGSYNTGKINIVSRAYNEYGGITNSVSSNISCHIEDYNKLVKDQNGKEVLGNTIIFVSLEDAASVKYTDRIQLVSRNSSDYENKDKEFDIINLAKIHGFTNSHWEIIL